MVHAETSMLRSWGRHIRPAMDWCWGGNAAAALDLDGLPLFPLILRASSCEGRDQRICAECWSSDGLSIAKWSQLLHDTLDFLDLRCENTFFAWNMYFNYFFESFPNWKFCPFLPRSFSAASKPIFASTDSLCSIFQALQDLRTCHRSKLKRKRAKNIFHFGDISANLIAKCLPHLPNLVNFWKVSSIILQIWKILQNAYLLEKIGGDTAENELNHFKKEPSL